MYINSENYSSVKESSEKVHFELRYLEVVSHYSQSGYIRMSSLYQVGSYIADRSTTWNRKKKTEL